MPNVFQAVLWVMSTTLVIVGFFALIWKIAKPHMERYMRNLIQPIQEQTDAIQRKTNAIHRTTTVNGGKSDPPTLLDKVHDLGEQVEQIISATGANAQRASDLADRMDDVHDIAKEARDLAKQSRDEMRDHEAKGEQYLGKVRLVMKTQGIDLPDAHDE